VRPLAVPYKTSFARQGLKVGLELEKMNPTCRWSSFDAIRLGREPDPSAGNHSRKSLVFADLVRRLMTII